jgi:hypothetical protein
MDETWPSLFLNELNDSARTGPRSPSSPVTAAADPRRIDSLPNVGSNPGPPPSFNNGQTPETIIRKDAKKTTAADNSHNTL